MRNQIAVHAQKGVKCPLILYSYRCMQYTTRAPTTFPFALLMPTVKTRNAERTPMTGTLRGKRKENISAYPAFLHGVKKLEKILHSSDRCNGVLPSYSLVTR